MADSYRRLRNTMRYMLGALEGFSDTEKVQNVTEMPELERYMLALLAQLDGDLRRALDQGLDVRQAPIIGVMTRNPRTVRAGRMATEAAHLMEQHRINGLIVVDADGRAVGALNIHDLLRARVV